MGGGVGGGGRSWGGVGRVLQRHAQVIVGSASPSAQCADLLCPRPPPSLQLPRNSRRQGRCGRRTACVSQAVVGCACMGAADGTLLPRQRHARVPAARRDGLPDCCGSQDRSRPGGYRGTYDLVACPPAQCGERLIMLDDKRVRHLVLPTPAFRSL